jgi:hypothetical protein
VTKSGLEPTSNGAGFHFAASYDNLHGLESKTAEAEHRRLIAQYLQDRKLCPKGYTITDRTLVAHDADGGTFIYTGVCT